MVYETILEPVLRDWSYWDKEPCLGVPRVALKRLPALQSDLALVIKGVRRCGKSTLLAQIMQHLNLPQTRCFFINFEDPRLVDSLDSTLLDGLLRYADSKTEGGSPRYFFLDEVQSVKDWEKWCRVPPNRHRVIPSNWPPVFS